MSWSLRITNGDISVTGDTYDTITGPEKMVQDLKCWILEPQGNDVMHPSYGSVLVDGSIIGESFSPEDFMNIEAELRRVIGNYQEMQKDRLRREAVLYAGKNTFSPGEICLGVKNITIRQMADTAVCFVTILAGNGDVLSFTV